MSAHHRVHSRAITLAVRANSQRYRSPDLLISSVPGKPRIPLGRGRFTARVHLRWRENASFTSSPAKRIRRNAHANYDTTDPRRLHAANNFGPGKHSVVRRTTRRRHSRVPFRRARAPAGCRLGQSDARYSNFQLRFTWRLLNIRAVDKSDNTPLFLFASRVNWN